AITPDGYAVAQVFFTLQYRHGGKRHHEMTFAAVSFFHRDLEVAAAAGGVEVVNFECARRDRVLINHVPVLADHHQRVTVGGAANNRGIAFFAVRQHVVVGFQLHAGVGDAVKNVGR